MTSVSPDMSESTRLRARLQASARAGSGAPPMGAAGQFMLGWGLGQVYTRFVGPHIREAVNKAGGVTDSPTFRPPLTPGWVARDFAQTGAAFVVNQSVFNAVMRRVAGTNGANPLLQAAGNSSSIMAGLSPARAGAALLGTTLALSAVGVVLDQVWSRTMDRYVEQPVNEAFGVAARRKDITDTKGNVPTAAVKQTFEEGSRQFARNVVGGLIYNTAWNGFGAALARSIGGSIAGPAGAVVGALGGMLLTSAITHCALWAVGEPSADAAQHGVRLIKGAIGMRLDEKTRSDVVPAIGDRVAGDIQNVVVPAGTAAMTGQMGAFIGGLGKR
jgi:hypothetical protein